jgi:hypothetical protein
LLRYCYVSVVVACLINQPQVAFASDGRVRAAFEAPDGLKSHFGTPSTEQDQSTAGPPDPRTYLYERAPDLAPRLDCIIAAESGWDATQQNPRSRAAGLAQFLPSTWAITPEGQLGLSPFEPLASIDAAIWLAQTHGWMQWQVYALGSCR